MLRKFLYYLQSDFGAGLGVETGTFQLGGALAAEVTSVVRRIAGPFPFPPKRGRQNGLPPGVSD
jgi:hypothetical protein